MFAYLQELSVLPLSSTSDIPLSTKFIFLGFTFFWGSCWGSFLNVLIYRIPIEKSIISPRSACPSCTNPLRWYENIPLISYLFLKGKCAHCKTPIGVRYPLIELMCSVWSLALAWIYVFGIFKTPSLWVDNPQPLLDATLYWLWLQAFVYGLIAITFIDLAHTFIPNEISFPLIILGCIGGFTLPQIIDPWEHFWGMIAGWGIIVMIITIILIVA